MTISPATASLFSRNRRQHDAPARLHRREPALLGAERDLLPRARVCDIILLGARSRLRFEARVPDLPTADCLSYPPAAPCPESETRGSTST